MNLASDAARRRLPGTLTTTRMLLRPPRREDAAAINAAVRESFRELNPWMEWAAVEPSFDDTLAFCDVAAADRLAGSACPLLMFHRDSGELLGATGFARIDWAVPSFEIGYWCRTAHTGHGFVTEATAALTRFAFDTLGAARVELRMDDRNTRSAAVAERLGFEREALLRREVRDHHGRLRDTRIYARLDGAGLEQGTLQPR